MNKKFSIVTEVGNIKWIPVMGESELTGKKAEERSQFQWKNLLNNSTEVNELIQLFPWENTKEKIRNLVKLFGFSENKYGILNKLIQDKTQNKQYISLSKVNQNGQVTGIRWNDKDAGIRTYDQKEPCNIIAYK